MYFFVFQMSVLNKLTILMFLGKRMYLSITHIVSYQSTTYLIQINVKQYVRNIYIEQPLIIKMEGHVGKMFDTIAVIFHATQFPQYSVCRNVHVLKSDFLNQITYFYVI